MWQRKRHVLSWQSNFFGGAFGFGTTSNCAVIRRFCRLFACLVGSTVFFCLECFCSVNYCENHLYCWIVIKNTFVIRIVKIASRNKINIACQFSLTFEWLWE